MKKTCQRLFSSSEVITVATATYFLLGFAGCTSDRDSPVAMGPPPRHDVAVGTVDQEYSSTGIERVIPIRFLHLRDVNDGLFNSCSGATQPCSLATALDNTYAAVHWANMAFRAAGVQFTVKSVESWYDALLWDQYRETTAYWFAVQPTMTAMLGVPAGEFDNLTRFRTAEWMGIGVSVYAPKSELIVIVNKAGQSYCSFPEESRYCRVAGGDIAGPGLLAHELGHFFGLHHPWESLPRDPLTLQPAHKSDFWDLYYCPGTSSSDPHRFFATLENAESWETNCAGGLLPILRQHSYLSGLMNCGINATTFKLTCDVRVSEWPLGQSYTETYDSDDWQLRGLGFPAKRGTANYGVNISTYFSSAGANRITDSQARFVRRTLHHEQGLGNGLFVGERSGRTEFGAFNHRQPQLKVDFDGDGLRDLAIWQPPDGGGSGRFRVRLSSSTPAFSTELSVYQGQANDQPTLMDFNGDGLTDIGWYRPSSSSGDAAAPATWYYCPTPNPPTSLSCASPSSVQFGTRADVPLPGHDFDGDGRDDIAVFRPSAGRWVWAYGASNFTTTASRNMTPIQLGAMPLPGLYDSDNKTDIVWWDPASGVFSLSLSTQSWPTSSYVTRSFPNCLAATSGTAAQRSSCVPIQGTMSWLSGARRSGIAAWDPTPVWGSYKVMWSPATSSSSWDCTRITTDSNNGRVMPLGLLGLNQSSGAAVTYTSPALFYWGQSSGQGSLFWEPNSANGCSSTTSQVDVGVTPNNWTTFAAFDMTGDGYPDVVQFDPNTGAWYVLRSESSFNPSTRIVVTSFGDQFSTVL